MKITNYDSVESYIKTDAADQGTIDLTVTSVTTADGKKVVTVQSKASGDLDYRLRLDDTTTPVRVGDKATISVEDQTVTFETPKAPAAPKEPRSSRSSGCASFHGIR